MVTPYMMLAARLCSPTSLCSMCSNGCTYLPADTVVVHCYRGGVVERCLPAAAGGLRLSCPVNSTLVNMLLNLGRPSVGSAAATAGMNATEHDRSTNGALPLKSDQQYYTDCAAQAPVLWPDFNGEEPSLR